jgi:GNAT superfamily N-acetyltransferase
MSPIIVRPAAPADLPEIGALWHEKVILLQQSDARFKPQPDAQTRFIQAAARWLDTPGTLFLAAVRDNQVAGFAVVHIQPGWPGMLPEQLGVVTQFIVDSHGQPGGIGRRLLDAVRTWLTGQGIQQVIVHVPQRFAIEQAFWRASGAADWMDILWLKL